jgi:hypothetical protein
MQSDNGVPERRKHGRLPCEFSIACRPYIGGENLQWNGLALDISCGGIGMVAERRFERGTILKIEVQGKHDGPPSLLMARVVRVGANADGKWVLGCQFPTEMDESDVREFLQECRRCDEHSPADGR